MARTAERLLNANSPLRSLKRVEEKWEKGRLKIFFGMCAGVGKTCDMLSAGHEAKAKGIRVVIGYVEIHGRKETMSLVDSLEFIPRKRRSFQIRCPPH